MNKTYVILEIARTYSSMDEAREMIKIASENGVNAIKIQTIVAKDLMVLNDNTKTYFNMLESLHRTKEEHLQIKSFCDEYGIHFLSTPESLDSVDLLDSIGVNAFKISSLDLVYDRLLKKVSKKGKPVYLSTGMSTPEEIQHAVDLLSGLGHLVCLMHCSSLYPTPIENANLNNIKYLKKFSNTVGYSDHTIGVEAPVLAVTLGATVIEKHFTLDRTQDGADHLVGVDPSMLKEMMTRIREAEILLGSDTRTLSLDERMMASQKRRKLISRTNLKQGDLIKDNDFICLQTKSPGGIDSKHLSNLVGRTLKCDLKINDILEWEMT
jgi:N,N'-diacetyllegionaminate synthase|tara:strand:- start:7029 stop:8000 length:972 start_codon:yes stop_codon:yes gene_type:complete